MKRSDIINGIPPKFLINPIYKIYEWYLSRTLSSDIPEHVAIIIDGNRRFSKNEGDWNVVEGHRGGIMSLEQVLDWCGDFGINTVTVYAFSTNNFKRPSKELDSLMILFQIGFLGIAINQKIHENKVRVKALGDLNLFPENLRDAIRMAEESTASYRKRVLNIAIGYDGRMEIVDAGKRISKKVKEGQLEVDEIEENLIEKNLYSKGIDDPDLIIRTGGEKRLSGFLLWQSFHSQLYFCDVLWPEFAKIHFLKALKYYQKK